MHDQRRHLHLPTARVPIICLTLFIAMGLTACKSSPPADDATLTASVRSQLAGDGAISAEPIQSSVQNGIATLSGSVSSDTARSQAAADAAQVAGIKTVVNNLTVQQQSPAVATVATPPPAQVPPIPKKTPPAKLKPAPIVRQQPAATDNVTQTAPPPLPAPPPVEQATSLPSAPTPPPPPLPAPAFHNITIPPDTVLPVRITQTLDSATTQQGDTFTGVVATDVILDNVTVIRQGTPVFGRVSAVQEAAHYKGNSLLTVELTGLNRNGERLPITTAPYSVQGEGRGKNTAEKVGGGAAVGAILGGILGGGKGAAIGAAAGGGVGAGANTITRGQQVQIASETLVRFLIDSPLVVRVSTRNSEGPTSEPQLQQRPQGQDPQ
jgi:hypothetical protein